MIILCHSLTCLLRQGPSLNLQFAISAVLGVSKLSGTICLCPHSLQQREVIGTHYHVQLLAGIWGSELRSSHWSEYLTH